jgi:hypothetical protein
MSRLFLSGKPFASVASIIVACALLASCGARQDGFDWGRMVLFSAIAGTLVKDGKPVANAVITREANFHGFEQTDTTTTDKDGTFSFPTMKRFTVLWQVLPSEPIVHQKIVARALDKDYEVWYHTKWGYEDNSELRYFVLNAKGHIEYLRIDSATNPIFVTCNLAQEMKSTGKISSICDFRPDNAIPRAIKSN